MSTWSSNLQKSAALLNDQDRAVYTDAVLLPYLNIALAELQETFELHNIPVTNITSAVIAVPAGTTVIGFSTTPALPSDLIEIQELFESYTDQNIWVPLVKKSFITPFMAPSDIPVTQFGVWAWMNQEIHVPEANQANDLKLDYIQSLFTELVEATLGNNNTILNSETFLQYRVAALAAEFIDENNTRSEALNVMGAASLGRSLGISIKGQQSITIRRRPFRSSYKAGRMIT